MSDEMLLIRELRAVGDDEYHPNQQLCDDAADRLEAKDKEISDLQQRIANGMKENMRLAGETVLKDKRIEELELALKNLINACDHSIKDQPEEYLCCPGDHCDCRGYTNLSYLKGGVNEARQTLKGDT